MDILIVDDHRLFADGLRLLLQEFEVDQDLQIEQVFSVQRALGLIDSGNKYDLILTDLTLPGLSGFDLLQSLKNRVNHTRVAVISASEGLSDITRAYEAGAKGYILKSDPSNNLMDKFRDILTGKTCFPDALWEQLAENNHSEQNHGELTLGNRPLEVLKLVAEGHSNKQIANVMNISETTVKFHIRGLFSTLGVNNRTWCVREAMRRKIINEY